MLFYRGSDMPLVLAPGAHLVRTKEQAAAYAGPAGWVASVELDIPSPKVLDLGPDYRGDWGDTSPHRGHFPGCDVVTWGDGFAMICNEAEAAVRVVEIVHLATGAVTRGEACNAAKPTGSVQLYRTGFNEEEALAGLSFTTTRESAMEYYPNGYLHQVEVDLSSLVEGEDYYACHYPGVSPYWEVGLHSHASLALATRCRATDARSEERRP